VWDFQIESTEEPLTAHGGLALLAEYNQGLGGRQLSESISADPRQEPGFCPLRLRGEPGFAAPGWRPGLEDLRELEQEAARIGVEKGFPIRTRWEMGFADGSWASS